MKLCKSQLLIYEKYSIEMSTSSADRQQQFKLIRFVQNTKRTITFPELLDRTQFTNQIRSMNDSIQHSNFYSPLNCDGTTRVVQVLETRTIGAALPSAIAVQSSLYAAVNLIKSLDLSNLFQCPVLLDSAC